MPMMSSGVFMARRATPANAMPSTMITAPPAMESAMEVWTALRTSSLCFAP